MPFTFNFPLSTLNSNRRIAELHFSSAMAKLRENFAGIATKRNDFCRNSREELPFLPKAS